MIVAHPEPLRPRVVQGESAPAAERPGSGASFSAAEIATAFGVAVDRVHHAMAGEFKLAAEDRVDNRQAQQLAEVLLTDQPLDIREAALMTLGAYTPERDDIWGVGDAPPGAESNRSTADPHLPPDEMASREGSFDPSQPTE